MQFCKLINELFIPSDFPQDFLFNRVDVMQLRENSF